jgi:hypothetical protein
VRQKQQSRGPDRLAQLLPSVPPAAGVADGEMREFLGGRITPDAIREWVPAVLAVQSAGLVLRLSHSHVVEHLRERVAARAHADKSAAFASTQRRRMFLTCGALTPA